jgi:hypothetical protein
MSGWFGSVAVVETDFSAMTALEWKEDIRTVGNQQNRTSAFGHFQSLTRLLVSGEKPRNPFGRRGSQGSALRVLRKQNRINSVNHSVASQNVGYHNARATHVGIDRETAHS